MAAPHSTGFIESRSCATPWGPVGSPFGGHGPTRCAWLTRLAALGALKRIKTALRHVRQSTPTRRLGCRHVAGSSRLVYDACRAESFPPTIRTPVGCMTGRLGLRDWPKNILMVSPSPLTVIQTSRGTHCTPSNWTRRSRATGPPTSPAPTAWPVSPARRMATSGTITRTPARCNWSLRTYMRPSGTRVGLRS